MIESTVIQYLSEVLDVPVGGEEPSTRTDEYVVLRVIDAGRINMIDAATILIESVSTSMQRAAELNEKVKNAMYDIVSIEFISSSKCGGGGRNVDTATKRYRYECIFNLYYAI